MRRQNGTVVEGKSHGLQAIGGGCVEVGEDASYKLDGQMSDDVKLEGSRAGESMQCSPFGFG